jgi:hypothetical protein
LYGKLLESASRERPQIVKAHPKKSCRTDGIGNGSSEGGSRVKRKKLIPIQGMMDNPRHTSGIGDEKEDYG